MVQYIPKSAVVAEIERRLKVHMESNHGFSARYDELKDILSFLDTIEVKEVQEEPVSNDLEETLKDYAYQVAYDLSNDWLEDNATWDDVETAVKLGARWQKQQLIDKACEWLADNYSKYIITNGLATIFSATIDFDTIRMIEDLKKAIDE